MPQKGKQLLVVSRGTCRGPEHNFRSVSIRQLKGLVAKEVFGRLRPREREKGKRVTDTKVKLQ